MGEKRRSSVRVRFAALLGALLAAVGAEDDGEEVDDEGGEGGVPRLRDLDQAVVVPLRHLRVLPAHILLHPPRHPDLQRHL